MTLEKKSAAKILFIVLIFATILVAAPVNAQTTLDQTMCYGYNEITLNANGATQIFLTTNEKAGIWVKFEEPPPSVVFKWYDPDGVYYKNTNADIIKQEDDSDWGIVFSSIQIDGIRAVADKPGKWIVETYIEGDLIRPWEFLIIDYEGLAENIQALQDEVLAVSEMFDQVQTKNEEIIKDYNDLAAEYDELVSQSTSQSDLEEIQKDYDDLQDEYGKLQASLGTTRMMMYASVVVAIASVAIAVYFGALKK